MNGCQPVTQPLITLDDCTVYVFIRQDIPLAQQIVQACHAIYLADNPPVFAMASGLALLESSCHFTISNGNGGHPNIVLIGVPDRKALERVEAKLKRLQIVHYAWHEPDDAAIGFASIATAALTKEQKIPLSNYRLWRYAPTAPAEHLPLKQEVGGENPSGRSIPCE